MSVDLASLVRKALEDKQAIAVASGILMELDQSSSVDASTRLAYLAQRFHISLPDMATALVESRP